MCFYLSANMQKFWTLYLAKLMNFIVSMYYQIVSKSQIPEFNIGTTFRTTIQTYDESFYMSI